MKIFSTLLAIASAGKGGKEGRHGNAEVDTGLGGRSQQSFDKQASIKVGPDGDQLAHTDYSNNEKKVWTVKTTDDNKKLLLQFDKKTFDVQNHKNCDFDRVSIFPIVKGNRMEPFIFCGKNNQGYLTMPKNGQTFPKSGLGQKGLDYPWYTDSDEVEIEFQSDDKISGTGFTLEFTEADQQILCQSRKDCSHVGLTQHLCDVDGLTKNKVCKGVACTSHTHCDKLHRCSKNKCEKVDCDTRSDCEDGEVCDKTVCKTVECTKHSQCEGKNDGKSKCNGKTNTCESVECMKANHCPGDLEICQRQNCRELECKGHKSCITSKPGLCGDGKCKCISQACVAKECTNHDHCPEGCICLDNECICQLDGKKVCRGHSQCTDNDGAQKCVKKVCENVECRNHNHCDKIHPDNAHNCADETSLTHAPNTCYPVECKTHDTCGDSEVCIENKCVPTACRVNTDCGDNELCQQSNKKDPTKNFCKPVDCTSNAACKSHSNQDCKDGKCLCIKNKCKVQPCVTSDHCPRLQNCHDNICTTVDCKSHSDCDTFFGNSPAKCFPNCETRTENGVTKKFCSPECRKVECRTEFDCDSSVPEMCDTSTNKCVEVECRGNDFCTETAYPDACKNGKCKCKVDGLDAKCTRVKCMNNSHCDSSKKEVCNGKTNECEVVGCLGHDDCGDFGRCRDHQCVTVQCKTNDQCGRGGSGSFQKCEIDSGSCVDIECIGHNSCDQHETTDANEDCTDGKCLCNYSSCEKMECRTNQHCDEKERCYKNVCEAVACTSHAHCAGKDGKQTCQENLCVDVDCNENKHCGDKQICAGPGDPEETNTCKDVDCIGHADCETNFGSKYMCERFTCVEKTCRTNAHCNFGLINGKNRCFENECEKVECSNHDHCLNKGVDYRCNKNQCEKVDCRLNSSCAEDELCDKESNTCYQVECRSHQHCQEKSVEDSLVFGHCSDGKCACIKNECQALECRNNLHCTEDNGALSRCRENQCETVACTAHNHCALSDSRQACKDGKCLCSANICEEVECRTNENCGDQQICDTGENAENPNTCIDVGCRGHEICQLNNASYQCKNFECEPVECTNASHCDEKSLCVNSVCEEQECRSHEHCKGKAVKCIARECIKVECTASSDCAASDLCDKASDKCYTPECKGHDSCLSVKGCKDGHCTCENNKCEQNICRLNSHCDAKHQCKNNVCVEVDCDSHDHCEKKNGKLGICKLNKCEYVDCKTAPDCFSKHGSTNYVCEDNQCEEVECTRNTDCIGPAICSYQTCNTVDCITNVDCASGERCSYNTCN